MARGVAYQSGAVLVKYAHVPAVYGEYDEETGEYIGNDYNVFESQILFEDTIANIIAGLQAEFPSMERVYSWRDAGYTIDRYLWSGADSECSPLLKNGNCAVFISEYCGIMSLSFCPVSDFDPDDTGSRRGIQTHWIETAEEKINRCISAAADRLSLDGRFSNGEQIFSKVSA